MFLKHNFPALLWALLILLLCGIPGNDLPDLLFWDKLSFDKIFHIILFFVLVIYMIRGFKKQTTFSFFSKYSKINAVVIATLYGGLTEIMQGTLFVGRNASIIDFIANFIGSLLGMFLFDFILKKISLLSLRRAERFDEIIFENRFKDYGAYKLRKNYSKHMFLGIVITIILFSGFFINLMIQGFIEENKNNIAENIVISELMDMPPTESNTPPVPPSSKAPNNDIYEKLKYQAPIVVQDSVEYLDSTKQNNSIKLNVDNDSLNGTSNNNNSLSGNGSDVYVIVDELPKFPGGDEARIDFLQKNVKYPKVASYNGIKGVVYINFIVEKDGAMSNIKLLMGIGGGCDEEALRVARLMPKWTPGKRKGQPVRVYINMPIRFFSPTS